MKIQFFGGTSFGVEGSGARVLLDATSGKCDIATCSDGQAVDGVEAKKVLTLPGEFEASGVLVRGLHTDAQKNVVYRFTIEDLVVAHFGKMEAMPSGKFLDNLGENIDVAILPVSEKFDAKQSKVLLEKVDPRLVIFCGETAAMPKIIEEFSAQLSEESEIKVSRSSLADDRTEFVILAS